jgi:hypothetical protein
MKYWSSILFLIRVKSVPLNGRLWRSTVYCSVSMLIKIPALHSRALLCLLVVISLSRMTNQSLIARTLRLGELEIVVDCELCSDNSRMTAAYGVRSRGGKREWGEPWASRQGGGGN